jgi:hypothetical protein
VSCLKLCAMDRYCFINHFLLSEKLLKNKYLFVEINHEK